MTPDRPVEVRVDQGGRLILHAEDAGIANWTVKRDWRRYLGNEIRAEGFDQFRPNINLTDQPPTTDPITLVTQLRRPNGDMALVVGTQTDLWVYQYNPLTYLARETSYVDSGYINSPTLAWRQIGSGFSASGRRWEAVTINGYLVLNNGVDLPVTYQVGDFAVQPIYELRENGVVSVGTIAVCNDVLLCGDVTFIISDDDLAKVMNGPTPYGLVDPSLCQRYQWRIIWSLPNLPRRFGVVIPCSVASGSLLVTLAFATKALQVGQQIEILGAGTNGNNLTTTITYISASTIALAVAGVLAGAIQAITVTNPGGGYLTAPAVTITDPTGTGATATATVANGLVTGITVTNAGTGYTNPTVTVAVSPTPTLQIADRVVTSMGSTSIALSDGDPTNSITGKFQDLIDDGSAILKMMALRTNIAVYKETSIYLGQYTATIAAPWTFIQQKVLPEASLVHRDTLVGMGGGGGNAVSGWNAVHIYAGKRCFYKFDLTNVLPLEMPELRECQDLFFQNGDPDSTFAAINPLTDEIWFCFPNGPGPDYALRFDFRFGTASTTSIQAFGACGVIRPESAPVSVGDTWFAIGGANGKVYRYGLTGLRAITPPRGVTVSGSGSTVTASSAFFTERMQGCSIAIPGVGWFAITQYVNPTTVTVLGTVNGVLNLPFTVQPAIYHRDTQPYDSVLQSGLECFGTRHNEKQVERYIPILTDFTSPQTKLGVQLIVATNAANPRAVVSKTLAAPMVNPALTTLLMGHYIMDMLTVSGVNNPAGLDSRILDVTTVKTRSFVRHLSS